MKNKNKQQDEMVNAKSIDFRTNWKLDNSDSRSKTQKPMRIMISNANWVFAKVAKGIYSLSSLQKT